jgi:hypothetical protein
MVRRAGVHVFTKVAINRFAQAVDADLLRSTGSANVTTAVATALLPLAIRRAALVLVAHGILTSSANVATTIATALLTQAIRRAALVQVANGILVAAVSATAEVLAFALSTDTILVCCTRTALRSAHWVLSTLAAGAIWQAATVSSADVFAGTTLVSTHLIS